LCLPPVGSFTPPREVTLETVATIDAGCNNPTQETITPEHLSDRDKKFSGHGGSNVVRNEIQLDTMGSPFPTGFPDVSNAKTLLELAGANLAPASLADATLVIIDAQNEYIEGPIAVPDVHDAVSSAASLLAAARDAGTPVIHIAHKGKAGSLFDRDDHRGQIIDAVAPVDNELVIEKGLPNAFAGTDLKAQLDATGRTDVIIAGFMTHMCVSSTARAAIDLGFRVSVDADSCATRDLPDGAGGIVDARTIHNVALVELSDRFAVVARNHRWA